MAETALVSQKLKVLGDSLYKKIETDNHGGGAALCPSLIFFHLSLTPEILGGEGARTTRYRVEILKITVL